VDAGQNLVEMLQPLRRQQYRALWAGFSEKEMDQMDALLRKLLGVLDG
jgi:MarR family transcriptional repressor of emrRAB